MRGALEVRKVPPRGDKVRAHALDGVHHHAGRVDLDGLALEHDETLACGAWPEPMDDISLGVSEVRPEVGKATLGALADLEARDGCRAGDVERDLEVVVDVGPDGVALWLVTARAALVSERELIRLARALVEAGRRGDKVGDIDGLPDLLAGVGVIDLGSDLDGGIPDTGRSELLQKSIAEAR